MAETRQIGRLTIHFLGDNAAQLGNSFDSSLSRSLSFRNDIGETARTYKHIYVGGSLEDLQDQPDFDRAGFDPNSSAARNTNAFGKTAGPDSYFIVVTNKKHHLIQDGQTFAGSTDLSLVHELLHPTQLIRELTETGSVGKDSEARTQMREQKIAEELGRRPGQDFPDVLGSGLPYEVHLEPPEPQLRSGPQGDPAIPVNPMKYEDLTPLSPAQRASLPQIDSNPLRRLGRLNVSTSPAISAGPSDSRSSWGDHFGNPTSSPDGITPRNPNLPVSPLETERPLGIFSGKPMPRWPTPSPIFDTRNNSNAASDQNRFTTLGDLRDGGKPQASGFGAGAPAATLVPSDDPNFSGGLLGRMAALLGVDPQNPDQLAPPPEDDGLRAFYRDPAQQRTLQRLR